jgi:hypothetical protein
MPTKRQRDLVKALRALAPLIPFDEAQAVLAAAGGGTLRELSPNAAIWLALTARIRHAHTDYDALLAEGYDRDAARFFVVGEMEARLSAWGATRTLDDEAE